METVFGGKLHIGRVKFLCPENRWGFIKEDATGEDYYVSYSGMLNPNLVVGDRVRFELVKGRKGLEAYEVQKLHSEIRKSIE